MNRILRNGIFLIPFFLCNCKFKKENYGTLYEIKKEDCDVVYEVRNKKRGTNTQAKIFIDESTHQEFLYAIEPRYDHYIDKYIIEENCNLIKLDSFLIPEICFETVKDRVEEFYVLKEDKFAVDVYGDNFDQKYVLFSEDSMQIVGMPSYYQDIRTTNLNYYRYNQSIKYKDNLATFYHHRHSDRADKNTLRFDLPNFRKIDIASSKNENFWVHPKELKDDFEYGYYLPLTTIIKNKLIVNIPIENKFRVIDLETLEENIIDIPNPYFLTKVNREEEDKQKRSYESDYYHCLSFNKVLNKLVLVQHVSDSYLMEDGFKKKPFYDVNYKMLIFNDDLELEDIVDYESLSREDCIHNLIPSKDGFYINGYNDHESKSVLRNYKFSKK